MAPNVVLEYTIHLTDEALVAEMQAIDNADRGGFFARLLAGPVANQSPMDAAVEFGAPIHDPGNRLSAAVTPKFTGAFRPPAITSPWFTSDANYPLDQASFTRGSAGIFGLGALFPALDNQVTYYWKRFFVYEAADGTSPAGRGSGDGRLGSFLPPPPTAVSTRRWVDGGELYDGLAGIVASNNPIITRHSSRSAPHGFGFAFRNPIAAGGEIEHQLADTAPTAGPWPNSWERFYIRVLKLPTANSDVWGMASTPSGAQGIRLQVGPAGELLVLSNSAVNVLTMHGTAKVLALNTWYRLDLLINMSASPGGARFQLYVNGDLSFDVVPSGLGGTGHTASRLGASVIGNFGIEFDCDDWINADLPTTTTTPPSVTPVVSDPSWFMGSRLQLVRCKGIAAQGNWSGGATAWRTQLCQVPEGTPPYVQNSVTALDTIEFTTDAALAVDGLPGMKGVGAFQLAVYGLANGAVNGRFGYKINNGAAVMAAYNIPNAGAYDWQHLIYNAGVAAPPALGDMRLIVEHSNSVQSENIGGVHAECEVLGYWGDEDTRVPGSTTADNPMIANVANGIHNAPYPYSPWAISAVIPPALVGIYGGTYVGTGVPRDLIFNLPIHWLWIRPLSGVADGARWWSTLIAPHKSYFDDASNSISPDQLLDPDFAPAAAENAQETQCLVRLVANVQSNAVGVTYQYIAVSDAAMRFMINGASAHASGAGAFDNPIWNPNYKADAAFFWNEAIGTSGVLPQLWYKGVGHATAAASKLNAAESVSAAEFLTGVLRTHPTIHNAARVGLAHSLWRRDDKSNDPGVPRVVQLVSYIGDNTASRVISLVPLSGRRPLFAMVVPHVVTTPTLYRDPSHAGTTSNQINNVQNAATGIIAGGVDAITVGIALNATGVVYDVFVLPGDVAAGNAGWSINGSYFPVAPGVGGDPGGWVYPDDDPFFDGVDDAEIASDLDTDLEAACLPYSHKIVNIALSRIGVTQQITDLGTEATVEATVARLHYTQEAAATLRDFPWAFATRYANPLTLVRGTSWGATAVVQAWSAAVNYEAGDVVTRGGSTWYARVANVGVVPAEGATWSALLANAPERANEDWLYGYRVPVNMIFARRIVRPGFARGFDPTPPPFRIGQDLQGDVIFTDERDAVLEYTYRPPCIGSAGDALFREAFGWRLAHAMVPGLTKDAKRQEYCWRMYLHTLERAKAPNANEQQVQNKGGDADWIAGRD